MRNLKTLVGAGALIAALGLGTLSIMAQEGQGQGGPGGGGGRGPGQRPNFDPAQMQQRMAERWKEMLEITDEQEWNAVQPLVQKVAQARMQSFGGMGRGMMMRPQRGGGDDQQGGQGQDQRGPRRFGGDPMPEA